VGYGTPTKRFRRTFTKRFPVLNGKAPKLNEAK
jgi:hypothetical protein